MLHGTQSSGRIAVLKGSGRAPDLGGPAGDHLAHHWIDADAVGVREPGDRDDRALVLVVRGRWGGGGRV